MAIKFEDASAPKGKPAEKPAEKTRAVAKEDMAPTEAPAEKAAAPKKKIPARAKPAKAARKS